MIVLNNVIKQFGSGITALQNINLEIKPAEFVFLTGPSGAGKTTLLKLLIRDLLPTEGTVFVDNIDITKLPAKKIPQIRRQIGMVFQDFKLLYDRTVFENVALTLHILGEPTNDIKEKVKTMLKIVGLEKQQELFPVQLAGGELQRAVIARAVVHQPKVVLADEPTGNLDPATSWKIINLFKEINEQFKTTVVMATHNADIVNSLSKRVVILDKGKIVSDKMKGSYL